MSDETDNPFERYDYEKTEQHRVHRRAMQSFREKSEDEKLESLMSIGLVDADWNITERYGGDAPNPDD